MEWRVRAMHDLPDDQAELDAKAKELEDIAIAEGGQYDGWERATQAEKQVLN